MTADLNVLVGQFAVSRTAPDDYASVPADWHRESLNGWHLAAHPTTHVASLNDESGDRIGWLLGEPWHGSEMVGEAFALPTGSAPDLEAGLYNLGGPWVAFLAEDTEAPSHLRRVYADAFGHLSTLYSAEAEAVATAPVLIPGAEPDDELRALFDIPAKDNWYPFGLTGYRNVRRLLPNHHLLLGSWKPVRHWPTKEATPVTVDEAAAEVAQLMKAGIDALSTRYPLQMSLTAGYDSRMILACVQDRVEDIVFVTNNSHPTTAALDIAVARRLAARHELNHIVRDAEEATDADRSAWLLQTGEAGAGGAFRHLRLTNAYGTERARLSGQVNGVLKGTYHRGVTKASARQYEAEELPDLLKTPVNAEVIAEAEQWIKGLGASSSKDLLDLLKLEQRLACWAGPLRFGGSSAHRVFWPIAHRRVLDIARGLPINAKRERAVHLRVIEAEWPELLAMPFNAPIGWAAFKRKVQQVVGRTRFYLGGLRSRLIPTSWILSFSLSSGLA